MHIELIKDINKVKVDAIVQVVEHSGHTDATFILGIEESDGKYIVKVRRPGTTKDFKTALFEVIKKAEQKKFKSIAIPMMTGIYPIHDDEIPELLVQVINKDAAEILLNLLLEPDDNCLRKIELVVDDKTEKPIRRKLALKKKWSKARKLAFVLDALDLDLDRKDVCKRHFIDKSDYIRYLKKFSDECRPELIKRAFNEYVMDCGEHSSEIIDVIRKILEIYKLTQSRELRLRKYLSSEMYLDNSVINKIINSFEIILEEADPIFPYLKDLVPDEKWKKEPKIRGRKKRKDMDFIKDEKDKIKEEYDSLRTIIKKIKELKKAAFPVDMLQRFWSKQAWKEIISDDKNPNQIAIELLMQDRDASEDSIKSAFY